MRFAVNVAQKGCLWSAHAYTPWCVRTHKIAFACVCQFQWVGSKQNISRNHMGEIIINEGSRTFMLWGLRVLISELGICLRSAFGVNMRACFCASSAFSFAVLSQITLWCACLRVWFTKLNYSKNSSRIHIVYTANRRVANDMPVRYDTRFQTHTLTDTQRSTTMHHMQKHPACKNTRPAACVNTSTVGAPRGTLASQQRK